MAGILDPNLLTGPETDDDPLTAPATEEENALLSDPGFLDYIKDIPGSVSSGLEKNISSYPGLPGDVEKLTGDLGIVAEKYLGGADEASIAARRQELEQKRQYPTTEEVHDYLSPNPYTPKTGLGRGIEEVTSLIGPRGVLRGVEHLGRDVILPLFASKAGEWAGEKLGPEEGELLSAAGGTIAGPAGEAAKRVPIRVLRGPLNPEAATTMRTLQGVDQPLTPESPNARAERTRRLAQEGVEVTGGQALGSEFVKRMEVGPFSGKGATLNEQQARQFTRAALERVGINADIASPEVLAAAQERFSQMYQDLIQQNNGIVMDQTINQALSDIGVATERLMRTPDNLVTDYFDTIAAASQANGGVIPPDVYQRIHSEISADLQSLAGNPARTPEAQGLRNIQDALYDTMGRNGQPEVQAAAQQLNNRYRNFKIVEASVGGAGQDVSFGLVSPAKLRSELERRNPSDYRQGQGEFAQLARAGQSLTAMPMSGTGAQNVTSSLPGMAHAAMVAPFSYALTSRPVQTSIVRRAQGDHPAFADPMQMPPILGMSQDEQPVPVDINVPAAPDQQSMLGNDYPVPVELTDPRDILRRRGLRYG